MKVNLVKLNTPYNNTAKVSFKGAEAEESLKNTTTTQDVTQFKAISNKAVSSSFTSKAAEMFKNLKTLFETANDELFTTTTDDINQAIAQRVYLYI